MSAPHPDASSANGVPVGAPRRRRGLWLSVAAGLLVLLVLAGLLLVHLLAPRSFLAVLETSQSEQDEFSFVWRREWIRLDLESTRYLADVGVADAWVARTDPEHEEEMICLVMQFNDGSDIGATVCSPEEHIRQQGFLWLQSTREAEEPVEVVSLYLLPDGASWSDLPVHDVQLISDRAQLFTGPPPPWALD